MRSSLFTTTLLHWYAEHGRELPWRETKDPYAIWLSEVILQQTRIQQGWAYWERFMQRWQTVEKLAAATEDEVLREWQGLGYYSRARNLHAAAKQIMESGGFPKTLEEIRKLKGVGDYTAAAIASFAFDIPAAVVDGNVYRVLSRYFGIETPINTTEGKRVFAALAQEMFPNVCSDDSENSDYSEPSIGATYNQAIMDFGALQCMPKSPKCDDCPLMETCDAFRTGRVEQLPVKEKKLQVKERRMTYVYIRCNGETAIHRRGAGADQKLIHVADGSGLSLYNYVTPDMEVQLLRYAAKKPEIIEKLLPSLPVAGVDGTLKSRMKGTKAQGNVQAKTGTVTGVSALAGYCTAANGHRLCFSIINMGIPKAKVGRDFQDRVCALLCR